MATQFLRCRRRSSFEVVLRLFHRAGSVQHQRLAAIRAEHQSREDVRLVHVLGDTLFVLTHLLHNIPLLLCDKCYHFVIGIDNTCSVAVDNSYMLWLKL